MASVYALLSEFPSADTVANAHLNGRIFCLNGLLDSFNAARYCPEHSLLLLYQPLIFNFLTFFQMPTKSRHEDVLYITA